MDIFIIIFVGFMSVLLYYFLTKKSYNLPPGPGGLPLIGSYYQLKPLQSYAIKELSRKYGPIFTLKLGILNVVVLSTYKTIYDAFITHGDVFSGRLVDRGLKLLTKGQGVIFNNGESWKQHRRTALHILRDFGFGREGGKAIIQNEIEDVISIIDSNGGKPIITQSLFDHCTANIICNLTVHERPAHVDKKFQELIRIFFVITNANLIERLIGSIPVLASIYTLLLKGEKSLRIEKTLKPCQDYVREKIHQHKKTFDCNAEPRDVIDALLLKEKDAKENERDYTPEMYEHRITQTVLELFAAGTETTSTTLTWFCFLMAMHPDIQAKMHHEITDVCGQDGPIKTELKPNLPYCCAVIDETMRFASISHAGVLHCTTADIKFMGYDIPKGTAIMSHLFSVHHDENYWKFSESFYPEHFLSEDGKSYKSNDHLIPFSTGRRECMGETLAITELFLITTSLARTYKMTFPSHYSPEYLNNLLKGTNGAIRHVVDHKLIFTRI